MDVVEYTFLQLNLQIESVQKTFLNSIQFILLEEDIDMF